MNDQTTPVVDPSLAAIAEREPLDQGEKTEKTEELQTTEKKEIDSPVLEDSMKKWQAFTEQLISSGLVNAEEYDNFTTDQLQNENMGSLSNKERRAEIEELKNRSKDPDLSVEDKAKIETDLKSAVVEQSYADFLFIKENIGKLSKELHLADSEADNPTKKIEAKLARKDILTKIHNTFHFYDAYMESVPALIHDLGSDDEKYYHYIDLVNVKLYKYVGRNEHDLSSEKDAVSQVLYNLASKDTRPSFDFADAINTLEEQIAELRKEVALESTQPSGEEPMAVEEQDTTQVTEEQQDTPPTNGEVANDQDNAESNNNIEGLLTSEDTQQPEKTETQV
jgi:hypothetical protein